MSARVGVLFTPLFIFFVSLLVSPCPAFSLFLFSSTPRFVPLSHVSSPLAHLLSRVLSAPFDSLSRFLTRGKDDKRCRREKRRRREGFFSHFVYGPLSKE